MARCVWTAALAVLVLAGCKPRGYSGAQRYPLEGKVTFDGQAVDWGSISFLPKAGSEQRVSGGLIENGAYSVKEEEGANAGTYRVEIRWLKKTGKQYRDRDSGEMVDERKEALPPQFHAQSTLTADVSGEKTTFDFDLKSK